jgi:hypothetical protein
MKKLIFLILIFVLSGCGNSGVSQTQLTEIANKAIIDSSTNTPVYTSTPLPTSTPTAIPTATPDTRVFDIDPTNLILGKPDLPEELRYYIPPSRELPNEKPYRVPPAGSSPKKNLTHVANMWTNQADADVYLNSTGRIYGYEVIYFRKGNPKSNYPAEIWDNVSLFRTSDGAKEAVNIWADRMLFIHQNNKSVKEESGTQVGDASRLITNTFQQYQVDIIGGVAYYDYRYFEIRQEYLLLFSVRNVTHYLYLYGREGQLTSDIAIDIANTLVKNLNTAELSEKVTFEPK